MGQRLENRQKHKKNQSAPCRYRQAAANSVQAPSLHRITSYNVCYTKLLRSRVSTETVGESASHKFAYSEDSDVVTITDAYQNTIIHHYDEEKRLIQVGHANGSSEFYDYDDDFNRTFYIV